MLLFDNVMLYNPKGDCIHNDAKILKGLASKKVQQTMAMKEAEHNAEFDISMQKQQIQNQDWSVNVELDSNVDMYEYERDKLVTGDDE